jgi:hypothetical protein
MSRIFHDATRSRINEATDNASDNWDAFHQAKHSGLAGFCDRLQLAPEGSGASLTASRT